MSAAKYGEVGDTIRKDGGCMGFDEVGIDDVLLESEVLPNNDCAEGGGDEIHSDVA